MKTELKTQTQKQAQKPAQKPRQPSKGKTLAYAAILAEALGGKFGDNIKRFYVSAIAYHKAKGTKFPRARNADVALMSADDVRAFLEARKETSIPAGDKRAQRVFDEMMIQAPKALS